MANTSHPMREPVENAFAEALTFGYQRGDLPADTLRIYIDGDGRVWPNQHQPPQSPTPVNPMALRLAAADPSPNVMYIAGPCQFVATMFAGGERWWTSHRYSETIVSVIDEAIDRLRGTQHCDGLTLLGYSGSGVVAALIAARRNDVDALISVASPPSPQAWTARLELTPLTESIDPAQRVATLAHIPQLHLAGGGP